MRHLVLLSTAVAALAGCAGGMSQSECRFSDWRAVGYEDGASGRPSGDFARYRKSCAEQGIAADFTAYQAGREAGLREYCQASRGYREGERGANYRGVCPADTERAFLEAYSRGRTLHELETGLRETDARISADQSRLKEIELELTDKGTAVLAETTTREDRARILVETKQLVEERSNLHAEIRDLRVRREKQQRDLSDYRAEQVTKN